MPAAAIVEARQGELGAIVPQTFADEGDRARLSEVALEGVPCTYESLGFVQRGKSSSLFGVSASTLLLRETRLPSDLEPGPADPRLRSGRGLQGASSSVCRRDGGPGGATAPQRAAVRPRHPNRGDDRRRHSEDARGPPLRRRRRGGLVISGPHSRGAPPQRGLEEWSKLAPPVLRRLKCPSPCCASRDPQDEDRG